ncbi:hypothetical protein M3607_08030 [Metabacillus litoralis]|nr:hypothetical protein [Metabacillus litoralis]MCM3161421.1 hypothetical protein [Metabacillus litoralis]MCM3409271.1 hypothetical protein [Metabacillus litoralis]
MWVLVLLCFIIYTGAYFCIKASGQSPKIKTLKTFDDFFIDSKKKM